ncbi:MAG: hypothetical protein LQ343_005330 [Gyalolechia ehrenbergii]|nr:MAG: hypothetical protein LQ343_005330 [Gyalolechia ehrenbergii]
MAVDKISSILAVADWLTRNPSEASNTGPPQTIHTILIAIVKAYDIQGCFQISNAFNSVGLDHVILVKVASTAVVSWLLGLSEHQAVEAISQAWMDGHPLRVYRHEHNAGPRKGWAGEATLIPQQILQEQSVDLDKDIRKITVRTHAAACLIINKSGHLNNAADRDHCMQYILAVALLKGTQPEACDYSDNSPWAVDRRVEDLREKIEIFESAQYTIDYLDEEERSMTSALTVVFGDGSRTKEIAIDYPLGSPKHAGTRKAVDTKVHQNLSLLYSDEAIEQICKVVTSDDETLLCKTF